MRSQLNTDLVLAWIAAGCNYAEGTELYARIGKNNFLKRDFPGKSHKYAGKLLYELCKSAGLDHAVALQEKMKADSPLFVLNTDRQQAKPVRLNRSILPDPVAMPDQLPEKHSSEYPPIIRRVISEYAETFQERSKTHRILCTMPESNARPVKTRRAELFDIIKSLSNRLELLYQVREEYNKTGTIPLPSSIWPVPASQPEPALPDTVEDLKRKKKNLQSSNSKDQNLLDYQSLKQSQLKNPMPAGTKRQKIENHIRARIKMIQEIDLKIVNAYAV